MVDLYNCTAKTHGHVSAWGEGGGRVSKHSLSGKKLVVELLFLYFHRSSLYSQTTHSMRKLISVKIGVADRNPLCVCRIQTLLNAKILLQTFSSFINLFPDRFFYQKVNFFKSVVADKMTVQNLHFWIRLDFSADVAQIKTIDL